MTSSAPSRGARWSERGDVGSVVKTEILTYEADGLKLVSHLYFDETVSGRAGVLVFPEAFGLGDHAKLRAERLAGLGYVTLACDLHGNGRVVSDLAAALALVGPLRADPSRARARAGAALKALTSRVRLDSGRVAALGYCFGGTMALELARSGADLAGVVGFHSGLATGRQEHKGQGPRCVRSLMKFSDRHSPGAMFVAMKAIVRAITV